MKYEFKIRPNVSPAKKWWSGWVVTKDEFVIETSPSMSYARGKRICYVLAEMNYKQAKVTVSESS